MEIWKRVPGASHYEASNLGHIRSWKTGEARALRPSVNADGYLRTSLTTDAGVRRQAFVHTLVAETFHGLPQPGQQVRHLDGSRNNNSAVNLAWGTKSENERDKLLHGTCRNAAKTHCGHGHEFDRRNTRIRPDGNRECRECQRLAQASYFAANREAINARRRAHAENAREERAA